DEPGTDHGHRPPGVGGRSRPPHPLRHPGPARAGVRGRAGLRLPRARRSRPRGPHPPLLAGRRREPRARARRGPAAQGVERGVPHRPAVHRGSGAGPGPGAAADGGRARRGRRPPVGARRPGAPRTVLRGLRLRRHRRPLRLGRRRARPDAARL
ncbi:MAG: N-acetyltransferase ElaA, partial [uncultured Pseudonocardia sp.]